MILCGQIMKMLWTQSSALPLFHATYSIYKQDIKVNVPLSTQGQMQIPSFVLDSFSLETYSPRLIMWNRFEYQRIIILLF